MAQKAKTEQTKLIAEAALSLADRSGWAALTFPAIAKKAKLKPGDIEKHFSDIWDILKFVLYDLEKNTAATVGNYMGDSWRDNLMEILMTRFDFAEAHRGAFSSLPKSLPRHPNLAARFGKTFYSTMDRMLKLAGLPKSPLQPILIAGFGAVYLSAVDAWTKDDTRDKSKTMAVIDKRLNMFENAINFLSCKK